MQDTATTYGWVEPPSRDETVTANPHIETPPDFTRVGDGLIFPEGPAYDGRGNVAVSNCDADYVTQFDAAGQARVLWRADEKQWTFQRTNGMAYFEDGSLFACDFGRKEIVRIFPDGRMESYADAFEGEALMGPNDLCFAPGGDLIFTDPAGSSAENPIGCVYRVARDTRKVTRLAEGLAFPNGVAFGIEGKTLYVAESHTFRILRYAVREDGSLGDMETFCQLPDGYVPDGMNFDTKGFLWVALYGPGLVGVIDPDGVLMRGVQLPGKAATNVEFAGADLQTLYITETETGALFKMRVETPGAPLFCAPPNLGAAP